MSKNEYLDKLKLNKNVYYIYEIGLNVYGLNDNRKYLVIWDLSKPDSNSDDYVFVKMTDWFKMIGNCEILPWFCACLNKKYVIKEYVKLIMDRDVIKLRNNIDNIKLGFAKDYAEMFNNLASLYFTLQILEDHKITNYKIVGKYYDKLEMVSDDEDELYAEYIHYWTEGYRTLKRLTDYQINKLKKEKILKQIEDDSNREDKEPGSKE